MAKILPQSRNLTQAVQNYRGPIGPSKPGYVQGTANNLRTVDAIRPQGQVLGTQTSSGGGGGGQNLQSQNIQMPQFEAPQQPSIDFDALIRPALDALESTVPTLQQGFNEYQTGQEAAKQTQLASTRQNIGEQEATLGRARTQQTQQGESAIDEARRQFSEIQQGLQARYGGTTGTGAFAGEIAGRETLQNVGNIRQGLAQAMQQIDDKLVQVKEIGRIGEQDIEQQTQERVRQAKENLNLQVADIRQRQGMLQAQKAQMTSEAIQNYQNSVNQFKMAQQNFMRDLYMKQVDAENQLKAAAQRAKTTAESYRVMNLSQEGQTTPVRYGEKSGSLLDFSGQPVVAGPGSTLYETGAYQEPKKEDDFWQQWLKSQGVK